MVQACESIVVFAAGVSDSDLMHCDHPYRGAVLHELIVLGEAAKHVSKTRRAQSPDVPWADVCGMRDRLVHYYHGVDDVLVVNIVRTSVPAILSQLRTLLEKMDRQDA